MYTPISMNGSNHFQQSQHGTKSIQNNIKPVSIDDLVRAVGYDENDTAKKFVLEAINQVTKKQGSYSKKFAIRPLSNSPAVESPLSSFEKSQMTFNYVEPGTPVMFEVGFPTSIYTIPEAIYIPIKETLRKHNLLFIIVLFKGCINNQELGVLASFRRSIIHHGERVAELMFFNEIGESIRDVDTPSIHLELVTVIRQQPFKLDTSNFQHALKVILATDLTASLIYNHFQHTTEVVLQSEKYAFKVFRKAEIVWNQSKHQLLQSRNMAFGTSAQVPHAHKIQLLRIDIQNLYKAIVIFQENFKRHFRCNTTLLHQIHKAIRQLYSVRALLRKTKAELSTNFCIEKFDAMKKMVSADLSLLLDLKLFNAQAQESCKTIELHSERVSQIARHLEDLMTNLLDIGMT